MTTYAMPAEAACAVLAALAEEGVRACVGGGWAVDALVGLQTRAHADLDLWVPAEDVEGLFTAFVALGIDRVHPWPGDRPWNFVLHDGRTRRVDLHLYEALGGGRLHYGSVTDPFVFSADDLVGRGDIAGRAVRCETADFALRNRAGYDLRDVDRHDIALLHRHLRLRAAEE